MRLRNYLAIGLAAASTGWLTLNTIHPATAVAQEPAEQVSDDPFGSGKPSVTAATEKRAARKTSAQQTEATHERLKQLITLDYEGDPFRDIKADLEEKLGVNILLDQSARDDSLDHDTEISVNLRGVPCKDALQLMLAETNATYIVQAGVVRIISLDNANDPQFFARRMFSVRPLLNQMQRWADNQHGQANRTGKQVNEEHVGMGMDMGMEIGGGRGGNARRDPRAADRKRIVQLIMNSVQPHAWRNGPYRPSNFGGGEQRGTDERTSSAGIEVICDQIVVTGPGTLLNEVGSFLEELENRLGH